MDYQSFKDYVVRYLWKPGDAALIADLDNLIVQAEAALNRVVTDEARHVEMSISVSQNEVALPADYRRMRSVSDDTYGEYKYVEPAKLRALRASAPSSWTAVYSLRSETILFTGPHDATAPKTVFLNYSRRIVNYQLNDENWFQAEEPDIFLYAVLAQTAPFLREDERAGLWTNYYNSAIAQLNEETEHYRARGTAGATSLPRQASPVRRGGYYSGR